MHTNLLVFQVNTGQEIVANKERFLDKQSSTVTDGSIFCLWFCSVCNRFLCLCKRFKCFVNIWAKFSKRIKVGYFWGSDLKSTACCWALVKESDSWVKCSWHTQTNLKRKSTVCVLSFLLSLEAVAPSSNIPVLQVCWVKWMDSTEQFTMVPDTNYCDIIIPTMNTVQMAYLLEMLLTNRKPVCFLTWSLFLDLNVGVFGHGTSSLLSPKFI